MLFALVVAIATAGAPPSLAASIGRNAPIEKPVSTSPNAKIPGGVHAEQNVISSPPVILPLTRAAARKSIQSISPTKWLAHFGHVEVVHRE